MDPILRFLQTGDPAHLADPGMAALPGATPAAPQTPALPFGVSPAQPSARDLLAQANAIPDAARRSPAFRTPDLAALVGALALGRHGGQFLGGYLQGKQGLAQDDTRRAQEAVDRQRQDLTQRAQFAQQDQQEAERARQIAAKQAFDASESAADRGSRERIAGLNTTSRETIAQGNNDAKLKAAEFVYKGKQLSAETKKYGLDLANQSSTVKASLATLMKLPEAARPGFARAIRQNVPELADWDDDAIQALGRSTASEDAKRAKAASDRAEIGYINAKTYDIRNLSDAKLANLKAAANRANKAAAESVAKVGLDEAQASFIRTRAALYEPDLRQRWAVNAAKIAKYQQGDQGDAGSQARSLSIAHGAYKDQADLASKQIDRILKANGGKAPDALVNGEDNPDYNAYQVAVHDQQEAKKGLRSVAKSAASLNPVTQGNPTLPGRSTGGAWNLPPAGPLVGGIGNAAGLGSPGQTRSGTRYRVVR